MSPCEGNKCLTPLPQYSCLFLLFIYSAYKTFCDVMEMKEVKIAGVQHWHLSTEHWTGSWTNNQEKQVSFDGQSCQHRLLVKRVNKERDRERGNDIFKLCWETDFNLLVLWLLSTAVLWAERRGDRSGAGDSPNYFIRAGMDLCNSVSNIYIYIYTYSISQKWVHPSHFCKYFIISFHVTTLKKWHFATM